MMALFGKSLTVIKRFGLCIILVMVCGLTFTYLSIGEASQKYVDRNSVFKGANFISKGPIVKHDRLKGFKETEILIWSSYFGHGWQYWTRPTSTDGSHCIVTTDKSRIKSADAVVFHLMDIILAHLVFKKRLPESLPSYRNSEQVWILHNLEPNPHVIGGLQSLNNRINATWTFIKESEIFSPYGKFRPITTNVTKTADVFNYYESNSKSGSVAMISNCYDHSRRLEIISELQHYFPVRVLGQCGESCPGSWSSCDKESLGYKFYVAIENSQCRDYVTEKYWRAIDNKQIPIVAWLYNMTGVVIPNSYINIYDFPSVGAAGRFIQEVGRNKTLYNSYFRWRRHFERYSTRAWDDVCSYLNSPNRSYTTYHDFQGWLTSNTCNEGTVS